MALRITFLFFLCLTSLAAQGNPPTAKENVVRYTATIDNVSTCSELRRRWPA